MKDDDADLLRRYRTEQSDAAFAELIGRHVDLVYSAALRQVGGDAHAAQDVTQSVFIDLSRQAARLTTHPSLTGWLYTSTRFAAANHRRTEQRRRHHEDTAAQMMNLTPASADPAPEWERLRPVLDDAMHDLTESDRTAVLARHFEQRPFAELGLRFGVSENAARMRVDRALEKLREALAKRGVTSTAAALAVALAGQAVAAAPTGLGAQIGRAVAASLPAGATKTVAGAGVLAWLLGGAGKWALIGLVVGALGIATTMGLFRPKTASLNTGVTAREMVANRPPPTVAGDRLPTESQKAVTAPVVPDPDAKGARKQSGDPEDQPALRLTVLAADTGQPLAGADLDLPWAPRGYRGPKKPLTDAAGIVVIHYPADTQELRVVAAAAHYAATMLHWVPERGRMIPAEYTVRLVPGVLLGGTVVDAEGHPVAGAQIGWNHEDGMASHDAVESHDFVWMTAQSDPSGRWHLDRIAADMLSKLYGSATHPDHIGSPMLFLKNDPAALEQLRAQTHLFKLGRGIDVRGTVVNKDGEPVNGARVRVGPNGFSGTRESTTDATGWFEAKACPSGPQPVTAEADGYAASTQEVEVTAELKPLRLVLAPGRRIRLLVVDPDGSPIAKAWVAYDTWGNQGVFPGKTKSGPAQAEFSATADSDGVVLWKDAPEGRLTFDVAAKGFLRRDNIVLEPDATDVTARLNRALTVFGTVIDADTGKPVPQFRMTAGWPQPGASGTNVEPHWSSIDRHSVAFVGGQFRHSFEEAIISGVENPGYILKFTADGYATQITRLLKPDEGEVQLDLKFTSDGGGGERR